MGFLDSGWFFVILFVISPLVMAIGYILIDQGAPGNPYNIHEDPIGNPFLQNIGAGMFVIGMLLIALTLIGGVLEAIIGIVRLF